MINSINTTNCVRYYIPSVAKNDVTFSSQGQMAPSIKYKKIGFNEGAEIFINGVQKQLADMIIAVVKHPLKTLGMIGGTALAIAALPLIGIPAAVGGGALALGFGALALGKVVHHGIEFSKANKKGTYDIARLKLNQMGEDTVDLALSAPFVPKAISNIKNFAKYGKISYNAALAAELKTSGLKNKWNILKNADKNLSKSISYQRAVDNELLKLNNLTDAEKAVLKKELLDFNVAEEKIAEVVLDKWAKIKGIHTKPDLKYASMCETTGGVAIPKDCSITLNDYKKHIPGSSFDKYRTIKNELNNGVYEFTYQDTQTGQIVKESISKTILDAYNNLYASQKNLSPQAKRILAILHEREHIHQYARVAAQKGVDCWSPSARGKELYSRMIQEIKPANSISARLADSVEVELLANARNSGTPASYIKNAREIGARAAESQAMANAKFQQLDKVFVEANKITPVTSGKDVVLNGIRVESSNV